MSATMVRQTMFTMGEVDADNFKRTDMEEYLRCAQALLNCEVGTTGLSKKRKGTKFLFDVTPYAEAASQEYEFVDQNNNYYLVLSANTKLHIFSVSPFAFVQSVDTPYLSADLESIDYALENDVLVLTHPKYPPARLYVSNYTMLTFAYGALIIYPYPAYDFNKINYNQFAVSVYTSGNVLTFSFTGLSGDPGFTSAWIGGQIVGIGADANQPVGYAIITNVSSYSGGTVTFTGTVQVPFGVSTSSGSPTISSGSQFSVRQPAWSADLGYPSCVSFYQNRLWLAGTVSLPSTIFGSKINSPINYDVGVGNDTDAIVYTIGQSNTGKILWLNGGKQLEIYTNNFEFAAPQDQNIALTPSTFAIRQQSAYGSSPNIKPITYINDSYYVTKTGISIINFHYNGIGQTYTSTNISLQSQHLVKNPINRALIRGTSVSQDNFIYYLNNDNTVTTFQFASEYKLAALTPIEFTPEHQPSNVPDYVSVLDVCNIDNQVYFLKKFTLTNKFVIEIFDPTVKLDSYIVTTMSNPTAGLGLITGLSIYNGLSVQIVYNGQDYGESIDITGADAPVSGGQCYVFNPNNTTGTVIVGLIYPVVITPMYIFAGQLQSNFYKNISTIFVDYYQSLDFQINGTQVNYQYYADIQAGLPLMPRTDTAIVYPTMGWNRFSTFSITQNSPFDLQITSIAYQIASTII